MEGQMDISDIMLTPEQQAQHYLDLQQSKKVPEHVLSKSYPNIFYAKRNMRQLLEQRTTLCIELGLTSKNNKNSKVDAEEMQKFFGQLFKDCPNDLTQFSWTVLQDRGTVYGFLASQDKFVPLCKTCSRTIYISMRGPQGRMVCSNPLCKIKLLAEFQINLQNKVTKSRSHNRQPSQKGIRRSQLFQQKNQEIQLNIQDRQLIRKAAKKIVN